MIYYFSGTGNSRYAARYIASSLDEGLDFIPEVNTDSEIPEGKSIGLVFPIYSWGVPPLVLDFVAGLSDAFWESVRIRQLPVWVVMTCGDEVAMAPEMIARKIKSRGVAAISIWSVIMPNNYVLLPGFDVDPKDVEKRKLEAAPGRLEEIVIAIRQHRRVVDVTRGSMPKIRSLVYPLFKRWGIFPGKWHSTDACIGCGICGRVCPLKNVVIQEGKPHWGKDCCSCLACYHSCPCHAVAYGRLTQGKGQYCFK